MQQAQKPGGCWACTATRTHLYQFLAPMKGMKKVMSAPKSTTPTATGAQITGAQAQHCRCDFLAFFSCFSSIFTRRQHSG